MRDQRSRRSGWGAMALALLACAPAFATSPASPSAPSWLLELDALGTWEPPGTTAAFPYRRAWVDARVANLRFHKRVLVEMVAPYAGGALMRTLHPARYLGQLADGRERWGTDTLEIYPQDGPNRTALAGPVMVRLRLQHQQQGTETMVLGAWQRLYGQGTPILPQDDPWAPPLDSPVRALGSGDPPEVLFAPFDDPGRRMLAEMDAIIARQLAAPQERHTLHAAMFNINDPELVTKLIEAHQAGVEVRLLMDGRKLRPWYSWYTGDDRLLSAGVPVLGVRRDETGAMHNKLVLLDGRRLATGSFNWESGARFQNHENLLLSEDPQLRAAYARRFVALAGGVQLARQHAHDPLAPASVSFAPDEQPHRIVGRLLDQARDSIYLAMFTAKDVEYWEHGQRTSLLRKLIAAQRRGVRVIALIDHGIHEASEYYGRLTPDDPIDEWLEQEGVHVVRADNPFGRYASMHHKFVVVDGEQVVTGAFNWYHDAAFRNDEDQLLLRDPALAARYTGEFVDLLRRYDADFDPQAWPQVTLTLETEHGGTRWGDGLSLVGELPQTGSWDPLAGLALDPSAWPTWRATLTLPIGVRLRCKLVVRHGDGTVSWEPRGDRLLTTPSQAGAATFALSFGR